MTIENRITIEQQPGGELQQQPSSNQGCCCCISSETPKVLLKIGRVIIFISCIVLTVVAIITAAFVASKSSQSIYAILECIYLLLIVTVGFYATLYHSRQALILFSGASAINSILLIVSLLVRSSKSPSEYSLPETTDYRDLQYGLQCKDAANCKEGETCCQQSTTNYSNVILGDDPTLVALLWCLAVYHIILTVLSGMIASCSKSNPPPVQANKTTKVATKSPGMKVAASQIELRPETEVPVLNKQIPVKIVKDSKLEAGRSTYRTQPVILISQPNRQTMSHTGAGGLGLGTGAGGTRLSPPKPAVTESSIDQIKNATTRVE